MTRTSATKWWLVVAIGLFGALAVVFRDAMMDDAYIGFTYARNVLEGRGFVFDGRARVEGVTNLGWVAILIAVAPLLGLPLAAKVLGAVCGVSVLVLTARVTSATSEDEDPWWVMPFVLIATATSFELVFFTCAGMETGLLAALVLGTVLSFLRKRPTLAALGSLAAFLVHPEAVVVFPLMVILSPDRRRALRGLGLLAGGVSLLTLARVLYFGSPVPNTFFAKPGSVWHAIDNLTRALAGGPSVLSPPFANGLLLVPVAIGAVALARRSESFAAALASAVLVGLGFALHSRPDWTHTGRYFAPYLPCAFVLYARGVAAIPRAVPGLLSRWRPRSGGAGDLPSRVAKAVMAALLAVALVLPVVQLGRFVATGQYTHPGFVMVGGTLVLPAEWVRAHLPGDAVIASRRIGALSYYGERSVFDFKYGLTEPRVARILHETHRFPVLGKSPEYDALWTDVHPGYVMEDTVALAEFESPVDPADGSTLLLGERFVPVASFQVSRDRTWVLLRRTDLAGNPLSGMSQPVDMLSGPRTP